MKVMIALNWRGSAAGAAEVSPARAERMGTAWEYFIVVDLTGVSEKVG